MVLLTYSFVTVLVSVQTSVNCCLPCVVFGCFLTTAAQLNSCDKDRMACRPKVFTI